MDGEVVVPQAGGFYGGWWITARVSGPFKGEPGTRGASSEGDDRRV